MNARSAAALLLALAISTAALGQPITSALTYQGELRSSGLAVVGPVDLRFTLFAAPTAGSQIGPMLDRPGASLSLGRFTQELDFGAGSFDGNSKYLEIQIRNPAGSGSYVTLTPRQKLTAAPVAQFALSGNPGPTGPQGATGSPGATGSQGVPGVTGAQGATGSQGVSGATGNQGVPGSQGATGPQGATGATGVGGLTLPYSGSGSTGTTFGVTNSSTSASAIAISAVETGLTGNTYGVFGVSNSTLGIGVFGRAAAGTGATSGVYGQNLSDTGYGVRGQTTSTTGGTYGVYGQNASVSGTGVVGVSSATTGFNNGVYGQDASTNGIGVSGNATAATGTTYGVYGQAPSPLGFGVFGIGGTGLMGQSDTGGGRAIRGLMTVGGVAIEGVASSTTQGSDGVSGESDGPGGSGVVGIATATSGVSDGVVAISSSPSGRAVHAVNAANTGTPYGVFSANIGGAGYAIFSNGPFAASGTKAFRIDHPDDPANRYLLHYASESPEVINFYRGSVVLDDAGEAEVVLPAYFAKINAGPTYQLTAVGSAMPLLHIAQKISESALSAGAAAGPGDAAPVCRFRIAGGTPGGEVSWRVEAVRNDLWVRSHGAPVELGKDEAERGSYQHPELYGQPPQKSLSALGGNTHGSAARAGEVNR